MLHMYIALNLYCNRLKSSSIKDVSVYTQLHNQMDYVNQLTYVHSEQYNIELVISLNCFFILTA